MDTAEIEVFLVLAEELHFGRTAERLRLPQPRVSRLVAALERQVGGSLFERTSRRVRLTPLGQQLERRLRPVYAQLTAALDEARVAARQTAGDIRIGFSPTSNMEVLTRLVESFEIRNPGCQAVLEVVSNFDRHVTGTAARPACTASARPRWRGPVAVPAARISCSPPARARSASRHPSNRCTWRAR
jgi:DNA-binding transcriptional LysR family regulator